MEYLMGTIGNIAKYAMCGIKKKRKIKTMKKKKKRKNNS